jgi:nicotinamidase-related amidase
MNAFTDSALFGGGNIEAAIDHTVPLLDAARGVDIPIVFTTHAYAADGSDYGLLTEKNRGLKRPVAGTAATAIVEHLMPRWRTCPWQTAPIGIFRSGPRRMARIPVD